MACSCRKKTNLKYVWTDGEETVTYDTEIQAKARVIRRGGTYKPKSA